MKICLICSDGGHLTEMMLIQEAFSGHDLFFITYDGIRVKELQKAYSINNISESKLKFFLDIGKIFSIIIKEKPQIIVSTGAEIAIPAFYFARLWGIKTIYIETPARINHPSWTGRLVYPVSDIFLVQWEQLLEKYGKKAEYRGSVF